MNLGDRRLYLCTPDRPDLAEFLTACIRGGVDVVQLRDKVLDARPLLDRAGVAAAVCRDLGVPFILNDRPDLALECGADGVHVGQDDAPPALVRRLLGPDALVGPDHREGPPVVGRRREHLGIVGHVGARVVQTGCDGAGERRARAVQRAHGTLCRSVCSRSAATLAR